LQSLGGRILVLGSTWPADERLWLPILGELVKRHADLRIVLCPHEPAPKRLAALETLLSAKGLATIRLSELMKNDDVSTGCPAVILVDSVGKLAEIYRAGHLAYVGGSFTTGVHNTMEPAVAGLPVLFGPRIQNAEEAGMLVAREAGFVTAEPPTALDHASKLLGDQELMRRTADAARGVVMDQRGAAQRSLALMRRYL
jgi:3-deoxy-D-manno-octulosonic-acid transferase